MFHSMTKLKEFNEREFKAVIKRYMPGFLLKRIKLLIYSGRALSPMLDSVIYVS